MLSLFKNKKRSSFKDNEFKHEMMAFTIDSKYSSWYYLSLENEDRLMKSFLFDKKEHIDVFSLNTCSVKKVTITLGTHLATLESTLHW